MTKAGEFTQRAMICIESFGVNEATWTETRATMRELINNAIEHGRRLPVRFVKEKPTKSGKYVYEHPLSKISYLVLVNVEENTIRTDEGYYHVWDGKLSEATGRWTQ